MTNFYKMGDVRLFTYMYVYIDHKNYEVDKLMKKHDIPLIFGDEYVHPNNPNFCLCVVKCFKWKAKDFETLLLPDLDKILAIKYKKDYLNMYNFFNSTLSLEEK